MGFWSALANIAGPALAPFTGGASMALPVIAGAAGKAASAGSQAAAQNRGTKIEVGLAEEQMNQARQRQFMDSLLAREQDKREGGKSAFRELQHAQYVQGAGGYKPKNGLKSYGFGPKASTDYEKQMAANYAQEQGRRLEAKDSLLPQVNDPGRFQVDPKLMNAGFWEKLGGIAGPALTGAGAVMGMRNNVEPEQSILQRMAALEEAERNRINSEYLG